ncbi:hypothetical protein MXD81_13740, partial [Microbacteriaceae bacterium K1510]|nr:hypothetical protein [Microbacteriaceae bacterium K1510]
AGHLLIRSTPYGKQSNAVTYDYYWDGSLLSERNAIGTTRYTKANAYRESGRYLPQMAEEIQSPNGYIITTYKNRLGHLESTEERAADGSKERLTQYQTNRFGQVTRKEVEDGSNSRVWEY